MVDCKVWSSYDPERPPERISAHHVRFVVISDTHSTEPKDIPDGDVLLHAGDLTALGDADELIKQIDWIISLPHPHKVIIGGNHDFALDSQTGWYQSAGAAIHSKFGYPVSDVQRVREHMQRVHRHNSGILHYLEGSSVALKVNRPEVQHKSWKVYGSPWTPKFGGWAWNYERGHSARSIYKDIPSDVDVLLTHGPPHRLGGLDKIHDGTHVGCEELARKAIEEEIRPHLWATGHIHEARGVHWQTWGTNEPPAAVTGQHYKRSRSLLINAAMVDFDESKWRAEKRLKYDVKHQAIIVDLKVEDADGEAHCSGSL